MNKGTLFIFVIIFYCAQAFAQPLQRENLFNDNWHFLKDSTIEASNESFNDSKWRILNLPHDWSIEDLPLQKEGSVMGPFDKNGVGQGATGFTVGGVGWYRKKFLTDKSFANRIVTVHFGGVYMNSDVWLNGHHLGNHSYGYTPFFYDLTAHLNPAGKENVLVVRVKNEGKNSRWYSGSGIYRNVFLTITDRIHVVNAGVYALTKNVKDGKALIELNTNVENATDQIKTITVISSIVSPDGKNVATIESIYQIDKNSSKAKAQELEVKAPALWSIENPKLYKVVTTIKVDKDIVDYLETSIGIRTIAFSAGTGFQLNGSKLLLKGGCIHHDNGPLGAAVFYRAEERKVELLKRNGFNAIRVSHNPPSQELLDACDRLGMLVVDESFDMWERGKNPQDYHLYFKKSWKKDLDAMVLRDRNHPSVILWRIGDEINERVDSSGLRITKMLAERVRELDSSRPVTEALCVFWDNPGNKWESTEAAYSLLDVGGYNYLYSLYENDHQKFPSRVMLGTESFPTYALENWNMVEKHPYVIGDFVWTAMDYMGEASIGHTRYDTTRKMIMSLGWPWFNGYCGDLDLIGNKKPQSFYRDVVWRNQAIAMAVHAPVKEGTIENVSFWGWPDEEQRWTWPEAVGKKLQVRIFSRAPAVRLYLNEKLIEEKKVSPNSITTNLEVPYQPGVIKAVNIVDGKEADYVQYNTVTEAVGIRLTPDRKTIGQHGDLSNIMVDVIDSAGAILPNANITINFTVSGVGSIAGVGNGDPIDTSSFQDNVKKTWRGQCLVILKSGNKEGAVILKARASGLSEGQTTVSVK